jgi:hypothetical protein
MSRAAQNSLKRDCGGFSAQRRHRIIGDERPFSPLARLDHSLVKSMAIVIVDTKGKVLACLNYIAISDV